MIINMLFYLINLEMGKVSFLFELDTLYLGDGVNHPLPLDIFMSNIPNIQNINIALLSCAIAYT